MTPGKAVPYLSEEECGRLNYLRYTVNPGISFCGVPQERLQHKSRGRLRVPSAPVLNAWHLNIIEGQRA